MNNMDKEVFNNMSGIIDCLLQHSSIPHSEYESVKLYADSAFILDALKEVICEYPDINIASIDITLNEIDPIETDLFVFTITDDLCLFIQSAYNGEDLYNNESKFVMCDSDTYEKIKYILDDTEVKIFCF